jgi:hypothetical protein
MDKSLAPHGVLPRDELVGATIEEWIVAYDECTNPLLDKARKGSVDLAFGAGAHNADLLPDSAAGRLKAPRKGLRRDRIGRVDEQSNYRCRGDQFVQ